LRIISLLGLVVAVALAVTAGTGLGADMVVEKSPSSLKIPLDPSIGRRLTIAEPIQGETERDTGHNLVGNLEDVRTVVVTDAGEQETNLRGMIAFSATPGEGGDLKLVLTRLNLVSKEGVRTAKGDSGVIGLSLVAPEYGSSYDSRKGTLSTEFESTLHYALIDDIMGFVPSKSEEGDQFFSYTETMAGKIEGRLPEGMKATDGGEVHLNAEIRLDLEKSVVGSIRSMLVYIDASKLWWYVRTSPSDVLLVQPVFIGTGPSDPSATGTVFDTLLERSAEIWDRCGSVRCISIMSKTPIYINNNAYRVIDETEAASLRAMVNEPDAVEVFVVERWDPYFDGGGACWSSGTASAKIVTCDQQLAIPCPMPSGLWGCSAGEGGSCGAVNYYHLAHELGHALNLLHPGDYRAGMVAGSSGSILEPSGFCRDNPAVQSAKNCRSASSPLIYSGRASCTGSPDIMD